MNLRGVVRMPPPSLACSQVWCSLCQSSFPTMAISNPPPTKMISDSATWSANQPHWTSSDPATPRNSLRSRRVYADEPGLTVRHAVASRASAAASAAAGAELGDLGDLAAVRRAGCPERDRLGVLGRPGHRRSDRHPERARAAGDRLAAA